MKVTVTDAAGNITSHQFSEGDQPHSIEVSKNAAGKYSFCCKVYFENDCASGAVDRLKKIYAELDAHFEPKGG